MYVACRPYFFDMSNLLIRELWKDALEPKGLMNEDLIDLSVGKICN